MKLNESIRLARIALAAISLCYGGLNARADYPAVVQALQPLTYWRFSETGPFSSTATNLGALGAVDNGTYNDPTAIQGAPGALVGTSNTAAKFDGSSTKIDVPFDSALNPASFSVECWAKAQGGAGTYRSPVTSRESSASSQQGYIFYAGAGDTWEFWTGGGGSWNALTTAATNGPVVIGAWTHLVGTYDAASLTMSFFINGALVLQRTNVSCVPVDSGSPRPLRVGAGSTEGNGNYWFNGSVDEVALYTNVLSEAQVATHYATGTTNGAGYAAQVMSLQPALYLRLDEPPLNPPAQNLGSLGAVANGRYLAGTRPSATDLVSPAFPGFAPTNSALLFDGTGEAMAIGYTNIPVPWTMSCWVNRQDAPGVSAVLLSSSSTGLKLEQYGSGRSVGFTAYGVADYAFNYLAPAGTWTHLSFVGTAEGTLLYADGELMDSNAASITLPMTSLGNPTGDLLSGSVDEVATFDRALLGGQVKSLYLTAIGDKNPPAFANNVPIVSPTGTVYATLPFSLDIDVYGAGPLSYQWRKDGTVVGTGATYTKAAASTADNGNYDVIVTNAYGNVTSAALTLTVNPAAPAGIAQQPAARQVYPGGSASFTVTASGTVPITYQWKRGGVDINGATNATLIVTNVGAADAAAYSVAVTNVSGGALSAGASLTLRTPAAGSYEAAVVASGPASYWRLGESSGTTAYDYMGGHDAVYTNVNLGMPGYSASDPNTAVGFDPANPDGPGSVTLADASPFAFIAPTPSFSLEAWVNWLDLTAVQRVFSYGGPGFHGIGFGLNTATGLRFTTYGVQDFNLTLATPIAPNTWYHLVGVSDGGTFHFYLNGLSVGAIAYTGAGITSPGGPFGIGRNPLGAIEAVNGTIDEAAVYNKALTADEILTHYSAAVYGTTTAPFILTEPAPQSVVAGANVTFSAQAAGSVPLSFQWMKASAVIPGATQASLTLTNVTYTDAGNYSVTVTNRAGVTNSAVVALTVLAPPSFANLTNSLVLHLRFDGTYADTSGRANDASAPGGSPPFSQAKIGQGVHIATTPGNNYLVVSDNAGDLSFDDTTSFTVSFWVNYTARFNDTPIIGNSVNSTYQLGWVFTDDSGKLEWSLVSTANSGAYLRDPVGGPVIGDGAWHNVVGVVDRAQQLAFAYIDGTLVASWSIAGLGTLTYGNALTIGQDPTGNYGNATFDLDDVGIWRRALTSYEAASIYGAAQNSGQSFDVYGPVRLYVAKAGAQLILAWQAGTLESTAELKGAQTVWTPVAGAVAPSATLTPSSARVFYRVRL